MIGSVHRLSAVIILLLVAGSLSTPLAAQQAEPQTVVIIPVRGEIDGALYDSLKRRIADARSYDPALIVFEIDTYGGLANYAMEITDLIGEMDKPKTVAYVPVKAYSAGAMIAMAAQDIVMGPRASLGDAAPVIPTPQGPHILNEKMQSPIRELFRKYAQLRGYPTALAEAMVSPDIVVYAVTFENGTTKYLSSQELDALPPAEQMQISKKEIVVKAGEILTMGAEEAKEYGFTRFVADDLSQLLADYSLAGTNVVTLNMNWSEQAARWLNNPIVTALLVVVGLVAVFLEIKMPGFGLPGSIAIACFALLIFGKYYTGMANYWEIIIFGVGLVLLAVELFVIPGFGFVGFAGIALIVIGLILMILPPNLTSAPIDATYMARSIAWLVFALGAAVGIAFLLAKLLPKTPVLGQVYLGAPPQASVPHSGGAVLTASVHLEVGAVGTASSNLRPAGRAVFDDNYVDVTTQGDMISAGTLVEIVSKKGNHFVVRAVK